MFNTIKRWFNKRKGISFKEALEKTDLPYITFKSGDTELNLMLDTGSNNNFIIDTYPEDADINVVRTITQQIISVGQVEEIDITIVKAGLEFNKEKFEVEFNVAESLKDSFDALRQESGIQIHGILGNVFFQKYKYILDFESMIAYSN